MPGLVRAPMVRLFPRTVCFSVRVAFVYVN